MSKVLNMVSARNAVDPKTVNALREKFKGKSNTEMDEHRQSLETVMNAAFVQAGDDFDMSKVTGGPFTDSMSEADKVEKIIDLHSELTALETVQAERQSLQAVRDLIRDGEGGATEEELRQQAQPRRPQPISNTAMNFLHNEWGPRASAQPGMTGAGTYMTQHQQGSIVIPMNDIDPREYLAAVITTDAGWDPFVTRQPGFVPAISRPIQLLDILPMSLTDQHSIKYMMQTTRASAAKAVAEGAASDAATMVWTERLEEIAEISQHIPVTELQLEDEPQLRAVIDEDLRYMVRQFADGQILSGTGAANNIKGMLISRNNTDVLERDWTVAANKRSKQINDLRRAKTQIKLSGRAMANVYLVHDEIWDEIALSETTAAGYYLGSPATNFMERLWGLPVVPTDHLSKADAADSIGAVTLDTSWVRLWMRRGVHSEIGWNSDDFIKRQLTIRAGLRMAVQVRRPQAIVKLVMP